MMVPPICCRCGEFAQGGFDSTGCSYLCDGCWAAKFAEAELMHQEQDAVESNQTEHTEPAQGHGPLTHVQVKSACVDIWSKLNMTCPAGWREAAVWHYVETEFSWVGAKLYRVYVHPPPPGAAICTPAVADVYLDFSMGRAKLTEVVKAILAAPPKVVEDFIGGSVTIRFTSCSANPQPAQTPPLSLTETSSPRALSHQMLSPVSCWTAAAGGLSAQNNTRPSSLLANVLPGDVTAKASHQPAPAAVEAGNKLKMTCPAGWREAAVRRYVETEFYCVGARVYRSYVHIPPPGAGPSTAAVADVYLDFGMGRARLGEAVRAMLAAPPRVVEDGVIVRFCTDAVTATIPHLAQVPASSSPDSSVSWQPTMRTIPSIPPVPAMPHSGGLAEQSGPDTQVAKSSSLTSSDPLYVEAKTSHSPAPTIADSGNRIRMTCPAGWREAAVRHYVEAEFRFVGARVYRAFVRLPPPGATPCSAAVADVYLDFSMGRARMGEAVKAILAARPRVVDDGTAKGASIICFSSMVGLQTMASSV
jgi:hypothetical protein